MYLSIEVMVNPTVENKMDLRCRRCCANSFEKRDEFSYIDLERLGCLFAIQLLDCGPLIVA